jgi:hypothetical protein
MGDDYYVVTVNTTNNASSVLLGYLQYGGSLLVTSVSPSPMWYAGIDGHDSAPIEGTNGLLDYLGLPWFHYSVVPPNSRFQVVTNQPTMPNVIRSSPIPSPHQPCDWVDQSD